MTSLTDVYQGEAGRVASRRQQLLGTGLFLVGVVGLVGAIALSTTGVGSALGLDNYAAREVAGVVAGIGLPAVVLGVFAVLPASRRIRLLAGTGAVVSALGVVAFQHIYPYHWMASAPLLALGASALYVSGVLLTFWCLFAALATFKTRRDPGGTAQMRVTEEGTIELVEADSPVPGLGGIGMFGSDPDGEVETQTNRPGAGRDVTSDGGSGSEGLTDTGETRQANGEPTGTESQPASRPTRSGDESHTPRGPSEHELDPGLANAGPEGSATTDGGSASVTGQDPITETAVHRGEPDSYCGNCRHFRYVMDQADDIQPYCTFHEEQLEDMEACSAWVDNG